MSYSFINPPQVDGHEQVFWPPTDQGMPYTPLTKQALVLSFKAHKNQQDKSGLPYVYHPFHLADQMRTEAEACVALLHDTIEDAGYTLQTLKDAGMPDEVIEAVLALTHDSRTPYLDYVLGLRDKPLARAVKTADLKHNSNLSRLDTVTPKDRRRYVKYQMALALLDDSMDHFDAALNPPTWRKRIPLDEQRYYFLSVFYDESGQWQKLSLDIEAASDKHYVFPACYAKRLNEILDPATSLFEALANAIDEGGIGSVLVAMDRNDITYQAFHY